MRKLAALTFVTLDGVMQSPSSPDEDPSGRFDCGGWAAPYWADVMAHVRREAMSAPYDVLFGRKTYEVFAGHFPDQPSDNPEARMLNEAKKYVASNSLTKTEWQNSHLLSGDLLRNVSALKSQDGPLIQIHGSSALINALSSDGMIDEYRLWIFPVVVGAGKRLFSVGAMRADLMLINCEPTGNGVIMCVYRRSSRQ